MWKVSLSPWSSGTRINCGWSRVVAEYSLQALASPDLALNVSVSGSYRC